MKKFNLLFCILCCLNIFSPPKVRANIPTVKESHENSPSNNTVTAYKSNSAEELLGKTTKVLESICAVYLSQPYPLWDYRMLFELQYVEQFSKAFVRSCGNNDNDLHFKNLLDENNHIELSKLCILSIIKSIVTCIEWSRLALDEFNETKQIIVLKNRSGKNICTTYNKSQTIMTDLIISLSYLSQKIKFGDSFRQFAIRFMKEYIPLLLREDHEKYYKVALVLETYQPNLIVMNDALLQNAIDFLSQQNSDVISQYLLESFLNQRDGVYLEKFAIMIYVESLVRSFMNACLSNEFLKNEHNAAVYDMEGENICKRRIMFYLLQKYFDMLPAIYYTVCPNMLLHQILKNLILSDKKKLEGLMSTIVPKIRQINRSQDSLVNADEIFKKYESIQNFNKVNVIDLRRDFWHIAKRDLSRFLMLLENLKTKTKNTALIKSLNASLFYRYSILCDQRILKLPQNDSSLAQFLITLEFNLESIDISKKNKIEQALYYRKKGNIEKYRELINECLSSEDLNAANLEVTYSCIPMSIKRKLLSGLFKAVLFNINNIPLQNSDIDRIKRVFMLPEDTEFFKDISSDNTSIVIDDIILRDDLDEEKKSHKKTVKNKINDDDSSDNSSDDSNTSEDNIHAIDHPHNPLDNNTHNQELYAEHLDCSQGDKNALSADQKEDDKKDDDLSIAAEEIPENTTINQSANQRNKLSLDKKNKNDDSKKVTDGTNDNKLLSQAATNGVKIEYSKGRRQKNTLIIKYTSNGEKKQYITHWHGPLDINVRKLLISLINNRPGFHDNFDMSNQE